MAELGIRLKGKKHSNIKEQNEGATALLNVCYSRFLGEKKIHEGRERGFLFLRSTATNLK